jgi:hypothetical protein
MNREQVDEMSAFAAGRIWAGIVLAGAVCVPDVRAVDSALEQLPDFLQRVEVVDPVEIERSFRLADADGDGTWTPQEAEASPDDVWWIRPRFELADKNRDGVVVLEEVQDQRQWESRHAGEVRQALKESVRQEMIRRFGPDAPVSLDDVDSAYLETHPDVAGWMARHPRASRFLADHRPARAFLRRHPDIRAAMESLRQDWVRFPPAERMAYFDRYPEFRARTLDQPRLTDPVSMLTTARPSRSVGGSIQSIR